MKNSIRALFLAVVVVGLAPAAAPAEEAPPAAPPNGPRRPAPGWHAVVGATVHVRPGDSRDGLNVLIRDGRIVSVSRDAPPAGAKRWDAAGRHVYAGFLDACVVVAAPKSVAGAPGADWNRLVTPGRSALDGDGIDADTAKSLRNMGFAAAAIAPKVGIFRGSSAVVSLGVPEDGAPRTVLLHSAYQAVGFDTARGEEGGYPRSMMGAAAVLRQTLSDASSDLDRPGDPLAALRPAAAPLFLMDAWDELQSLRAIAITREFGRKAALLGTGLEFKRLHAIADAGLPVVLPLTFPKKPDVGSIGAIEDADLTALMAWEQGPTNPRRLDAAGVTVALTTARLEDRTTFPKLLAKAIENGLPRDRALAMLTVNPAEILGLTEELGTVEAGRRANLVVTDGPLFEHETRIRMVFTDGVPHEVRPDGSEGEYEVTSGPGVLVGATLAIDEHGGLEVRAGEETVKAKANVARERISFSFDGKSIGAPGGWVLDGTRAGLVLGGRGVAPDGTRFSWRARRATGPAPEKEQKEKPAFEPAPETFGYPFGPYATDALPEMEGVLFVRNATLWTSGPAGRIEDGVLIVSRGKILYAGPGGDDAAGAVRRLDPNLKIRTIDAKGKHVTPGIIDCHSHTGLRGDVNESGQAVAAEVRVKDIADADDINWYRQLAGGVTVVNSLHGSANPIGGQNLVRKLRWGVRHPDEMVFEGAKPGIKFALGENVKQSNWGDKHTTRYPQTRMGVETLMRDRLQAAREYASATDRRRDLELEALAEVLRGDRLVHCHAYRQDEILMLCRLADEFGFTIGTFQHVLEGYKVAEAMKAHGAGASAFSDWWAFKMEVQDAIPTNGALMWEVGVLTSFNSDSSELARRLNLEAAKAVKYGGIPPVEALKFVTINPARQLGIDDRVGSLERGKDADFVIWTGNPLSTRSRCERTFIDGREYFSLEKDRAHRERIRAERLRLVQKALRAPDEGGGKSPPGEKEYHHSCHEGGGR